MYHNLRRTFGATLCLLGLASPLVFAAEPPSKPLHAAQLVAMEGASDTYRLMDYDHRVIKASVPAQSITDVKTPHSDGTVDGTVQATVSSIDMTTSQIRASTDAGQVLVLAIPREDLGSMRVRDTFALVVPHQTHHAKVGHRPHHAKVAENRKVAQSQ